MKLSFVKMHGLGNDYVFLDGRNGLDLDEQAVVAISDRRTGVGGDGVIVLERPRDAAHDARMSIFNADGSDGGVCGNGLRCLAAWVVGDGLIEKDSLTVEIGGGVVHLRVDEASGTGRSLVSVELPPPRFACAEIPARVPGLKGTDHVVDRAVGPGSPAVSPDLQLDRPATLTLVSTGNPHAVIWLGETMIDQRMLDELVQEIGPGLERHVWFPERVNVHVCCGTADGPMRAATWERGSGRTLACGTGAAAVLVAGVLRGNDGLLVESGSAGWVSVELPGGVLENSWSGRPESPIRQRGEAVEVFRGSTDRARLGF